MNQTSATKAPRVLLIASIVASVLSICIRSIFTVTLLDTNYGVYVQESMLPTVFHAALAVICAAMAAYAIICVKGGNADYFAKSGIFHTFASFVCGFLLAADILIELFKIATEAISPNKFDVLEIIFALPAVIFFICIAIKPQKASAALTLTSFFPIAWCAVCLIRIYFDTTVLMTSPNKILGQIALLSAMIFFLTESRMLVSNFSHKFFLAAASVAPVLLLTSGVPGIIFADKLAIGTSDSIIRCAVEVAFALFIYARLAAYVKHSENQDSIDK